MIHLLPVELALQVINQLDVISKLKLSHTNHFLRQLVKRQYPKSQKVQVAHGWKSPLVIQFFVNCFYFEIYIANADPESISLVSKGVRISYLAPTGYLSINERLYRFAMPWTSGDTIGCGFYFNPPQMFFTKNGLWIGDAPFHLDRNINYRKLWIPELRGPGNYVVNLAGPFKYDLSKGAEHLEQRKYNPKFSEKYNMNEQYFPDNTGPTLFGDIVRFPASGMDIARSVQLCKSVKNGSYYRIRVLDDAPTSFLSVGLAHFGYSPFHHIGWDWGSIAYHSDDGNIYHQTHTAGKPFHTSFRKGDIVGVGMHNTRVFFTLNDIFLHPLHFIDVNVPMYFSFACNGGWVIQIESDAKLNKSECSSLSGLFLPMDNH